MLPDQSGPPPITEAIRVGVFVSSYGLRSTGRPVTVLLKRAAERRPTGLKPVPNPHHRSFALQHLLPRERLTPANLEFDIAQTLHK